MIVMLYEARLFSAMCTYGKAGEAAKAVRPGVKEGLNPSSGTTVSGVTQCVVEP